MSTKCKCWQWPVTATVLRVTSCLSMPFRHIQYNMVNAGGTDQEANCTMHHGILSARGKYWAGLRSAVEPVFHSGQLTAVTSLLAILRLTLWPHLQRTMLHAG